MNKLGDITYEAPDAVDWVKLQRGLEKHYGLNTSSIRCGRRPIWNWILDNCFCDNVHNGCYVSMNGLARMAKYTEDDEIPPDEYDYDITYPPEEFAPFFKALYEEVKGHPAYDAEEDSLYLWLWW